MKATILFTNMLALGAGFIGNAVADTSCYNAGQAIDRGLLRYHSQRACEGYDGKRGAFQGTFGPNEFKSACVTVGGDRINMEVQNLNTRSSFDLKDTDCTKEFNNIVTKCIYDTTAGPYSQGGYTTNAGWWFRIDPNSGKC